MVSIADKPLIQNITITGWYMKKFVDDNAMVTLTGGRIYPCFYTNNIIIYKNLTIIPSVNHADKQSILYEVTAFDRAMMVKYRFYDFEHKSISNYSSGVLRNMKTIPDITLPRYTRYIVNTYLTVFYYNNLRSSLYVHTDFRILQL